MSLLHSIPFKHAIHFLACITLDLISCKNSGERDGDHGKPEFGQPQEEILMLIVWN